MSHMQLAFNKDLSNKLMNKGMAKISWLVKEVLVPAEQVNM